MVLITFLFKKALKPYYGSTTAYTEVLTNKKNNNTKVFQSKGPAITIRPVLLCKFNLDLIYTQIFIIYLL